MPSRRSTVPTRNLTHGEELEARFMGGVLPLIWVPGGVGDRYDANKREKRRTPACWHIASRGRSEADIQENIVFDTPGECKSYLVVT